MPAYKAMAITKEKTASAAYKALENKAEFADQLAAIPFRHPVQLYEAVGYALVFFFMYFGLYNTSKRNKPGYLFGFWLVGFFTLRFWLESYKKSQGGFESALGDLLSTGQWLSIPFVLLGLFLMFRPKPGVSIRKGD